MFQNQKLKIRSCDRCPVAGEIGKDLIPVRVSTWPRTSDRTVWDGLLCEACCAKLHDMLNQLEIPFPEKGKE